MTIPGVGQLTALAFTAAIADPRFRQALDYAQGEDRASPAPRHHHHARHASFRVALGRS